MTYTDGKHTIFSVLQGKMRGRYFDAHSADVVGTFEFMPGEKHLSYPAMTAQYATTKAPAVRWQKEAE